MNRTLLCTLLFLLALTVPAFANPTVSSPGNGAEVSSPFTLSADASTCSSQTVTSMGFSLDSSSDTTIVKGTSVNASVTAALGAHTLHVKSWGSKGASCVTDVAITVIDKPASPPSPANAVSVSSPTNGSTITSPFTLTASISTCSSQAVSAMGYSLDNSTDTTIVDAKTMNASVTAAAGAHTLHVKAWGTGGAACDTNVAFTVSTASTGTTADGISITSPANGSKVASPFTLAASTSTCSSQTVSAMGYSLDSSSDTTIVDSKSMQASVTAATGAHTLHVKSWGIGGAACSADVAITVTTSTTGTTTDGISVSSPANGADVSSTFDLTANASTCSSQPVSTMGYSLDNSSDTTTVGGTSVNASVSAAAGAHTLHVKSWGTGGSACAAAVAISVGSSGDSGSSATSMIPSDAVSVSSIQTLSNWESENDTAVTGSSSGSMALVSSPAVSGDSRKFVTKFSNAGNERYDVSFGDDTTSTNFFYDAWVYLTSSSSQLANLEMDMNQTMPNGQTAIFGFQCDGYNNTWDYTANKGTPEKPVDTWVPSKQSCNVRNWSINTWHHVQVSYSRNDSGDITYQTVWLDGVEQDINATVNSAFALGWAPSLLTNFQIDGLGSSGTTTVYLDKLTIYRW